MKTTFKTCNQNMKYKTKHVSIWSLCKYTCIRLWYTT